MATETARQHIASVAAEHGWTNVGLDATADTEDIYVRGDVRIVAAFTATGVVNWADLRRDGAGVDYTGPRKRRETVVGWLTEAVEQAPIERAAISGPFEIEELPGLGYPVRPSLIPARGTAEQTAADILAARDDVIGTRSTGGGDVAAVELLGSHRLVGWVDQQGRLLTSLLHDDDPVIVPASVVESYVDSIAAIPGTHHIRQDERADIARGLIEQAEAERQDAEQASRFDDPTPCARCGAPFSSNRHNYADGHSFEAPGSGTYATLDEAEAGMPRASVERLRTAAVAKRPADVRAVMDDHARIVLARIAELEARLSAALESELVMRDERDEARALVRKLSDAATAPDDRIGRLESQLSAARARAEQWREMAARTESERLDMERLRDDERIRGDRLAEQYTSLRADITRALDQDDTGPIPTDEQLVRDVTDLREAGRRVVSTLIAQRDGSADGLALSLRASSAVRQLADAVCVTIPREDAPAPHEESDEDRGQADAGPAASPMFAHIITSEAPGLGDPEVLIVDDHDNEPVARWKVSDPEADIRDVMREIVAAGWRSAGSQDEWTNVQAGYWIIPVEKL